MLKECGRVHSLLAAPIQQLLAVCGESPDKAARLIAIHERSVRETEVRLKRRQSFNDPKAVARFLRKRLDIWYTMRSGVYFSMPSTNVLPSRFCFEDPLTVPTYTPARC